MPALAIETSGRQGSVATVDAGHVLAEETFDHGLRHAAGILAIIDRLTRAAGWGPADLAEIYVSAGPGSFTGLRVGVTVAKTLALALGVKLVAVPTVEVLARNAPAGWQNLVIVLDAKRDQIFTATFAKHSGGPIQTEPARLDALPAILARTPRPVHLLGEGIPYHRKFIPESPDVIVTPEDTWRPRAAAVAEIGHAMARTGEFTDADRLTPIYIRKPEAEEKWDAAQTGGPRR
ncbi:MAG TPA: tRNA (adenosine(37)-N6)-threonylcarbamoyltransferase complex dimerization subunit type 1 TsaB [Tepidisphaeraceae bacterium]|nr:tRNA (adenosine(37)-N6)-threonylcarbamoyltransferase complex dimerization subunit type 1 TsaB [Tepidisphaeraceae bacterium]